MKLIQIESENNFPHKDISDETAAMLELLLLNRELIMSCHDNAEMVSLLYRLGHKTLNFTAQSHLEESKQFTAFSYGIGALEAVATIVRPLGTNQSEQAITHGILTTHAALNGAFVDTLVDARDKFSEELPRTHQVIGESATRFYRAHQDYALSGAAIARELEIQTAAA